MGRGSEGHAGGSERRQGQPRMHETYSARPTEEHDEAARAVKQRRAGSRFRYRRRRMTVHHLRPAQDAHFYVFFLAALWTTLVAAGVMASIGTIAFGTDTERDWTSVRTAVENRFNPAPPSSVHSSCNSRTQPHGFSAHNSTSATPSFRRAYATLCYYRPWLTFAHASLRPQKTCICPYIFTPATPTTRLSLPTAHQLQPAPPITCNRSPARPIRTDSSSLPASLRPTGPLACRPDCLGRLAWTRPLLCRTAQRLHTGKLCHAISHSTLHTLQKWRKENYEKKIPIHRSNSVFQELGRRTRAQHTWHQPRTRANPAYVLLVPQPLAPHNHRSLRAGTRAESTSPLTPAHTLPHGRLQRTDDPSFRDLRLRGRPSTSPSPLFTQIAAASTATPALQPTWGSPATLLVLVGVWVDTCVQRMRDRHGTHSAPAVQFMGTPASAVSQTRPEQQPRNQQLGIASHSAPSCLSELGSGTTAGCMIDAHGHLKEQPNSDMVILTAHPCSQQLGIASHSAPSCLSELGSETSDSCMTGAHGYLTEQLELDRALLTGALQPKFDTSVWNSRGKASQHSTPPRTSELGSGMTSRCAVHDHSPYIAEKNPGTLQLDLDTPLWNSRGKALQHSAPSSISELGSGMTSGCAVSGLTGNPCLAERTKRRADLELESQALRKCFRRGDRRKQLEAEQLKRATAADDHRHPGTTERPDSLGTVDPETQPWREQRQADCSNKATRTASAPSLMECPQAAASNLPPSNTPLSDAPPRPLLPTADAPLKPSSPSNPAPGGRSWNTDPQALNA